jgi:hypothetical protein
MSRSKTERYVYAVGRADGLVKVGQTGLPRERLPALKTYFGASVVVWAMRPVLPVQGGLVETRAHALLPCPVRGRECFAVSPEDAVSAIDQAVQDVSHHSISQAQLMAGLQAMGVRPGWMARFVPGGTGFRHGITTWQRLVRVKEVMEAAGVVFTNEGIRYAHDAARWRAFLTAKGLEPASAASSGLCKAATGVWSL